MAVRKSLEKFYSQNEQGSLSKGGQGVNDFVDRAMGCAQETLEGILSYMHRECVHPANRYLEEYMESDRDGKFEMDNHLDSLGCTP